MSSVTLGDLTRSFQLRTQQFSLKSEMDTLLIEVASGQSADLAKKVGGNLTPISGIESDLAKVRGYQSAATNAGVFTDLLQTALGAVQDQTQQLATSLITAGASGSAGTVSTVGTEANIVFASVISSLNSAAGGRSLLAGNATDTNPLADVETFRAELVTAVASASTVADVEAAVSAWFAPGGGFDTVGYTGSTIPLNDFRLGENRKVDMSLTAQDSAISEVLKATALSALIDEGVLAGDPEAQLALVKRSGEILQAAQTGFTDLRSRLGANQQAIELAQQSLSTKDYALQFAKLEIVAIDPFESAGKLDNVRVQLETLYSITARVSRLSLMEYLR